MVIALLFVSLLGSLAGAGLVAFAGMGLAMGVLAYVAGGMLGTVGFLALIALRCRLQMSPPRAQVSP